jgi:hypothetical protein
MDCQHGSSNNVVANVSDNNETDDDNNNNVPDDDDETDNYRGPIWPYEAERAPKDTRRACHEVYMP